MKDEKEIGMKRLSVILGVLVLLTAAQATVPLYDQTILIPQQGLNAAAVAWGDVNNDGRPDLLIGSGNDNGSVLYLNLPTGFEVPTLQYNLSQMTNVLSVQFVDYNADGRLDVFCLTDDTHGARLFRQTATQRFQEVDLLPTHPLTEPIHSAVWTDLDGDGDLDVLLSNLLDTPNVRGMEQTSTQFIEMRGSIFPTDEQSAGALCVVDFDRDTDLDVLLGYTNEGQSARLYRRDGSSYVAWGESASLPEICGRNGAVWTDYDNDQFPDLILPGSSGEAYLLRSVPAYQSRGFDDQTAQPGFLDGVQDSRDVQCADFNLDGYPDLLVLPIGNDDPRVVTNLGGTGWSTQSISVEFGNHHPFIKSAAIADFDNDGDLDFALGQGADGVRLFRNDTKDPHEWIGISLLNSDGVTSLGNANLVMQFEQSKQWSSTSALTSASGQDCPVLYLANTGTDKSGWAELEIWWPNGLHSIVPYANLNMDMVNSFAQPTQPGVSALTIDAPIELTNAPNPFNPTTTLSFTLPRSGTAKLAVYDVLGREAAVLADGPYQAGTYSLTFDAANLPSGIYFARLTAAGETRLNRMLLLK
jgi:hypothetical protein